MFARISAWNAVFVLAAAALGLTSACNGSGAPTGPGTDAPSGAPTVTAAATAARTPQGGGWTGEPTGRLAFVSFRRGDQEVFIKELPDGEEIDLTNDPSDDFDPDISEDGKQIAFVSNRTGQPQVYVMNADGSGLRQLTDSRDGAQTPRWSRDARRIAYSDGGAVAVIAAEGGEVTRLLEPEAGASPAPCKSGAFVGGWSPDDRTITYYSATVATNEGQVCTVPADGGEPTALVSAAGEIAAEPVFSPDGTQIVYRAIINGQHDIWLLDVASGERTNLTDDADVDIEPDWSPDGQWIAFGSLRPGAPFFDLYVMRPDGSDVRQVTDDPAKEANPVWGPSE
jgi:TolB protein